MEFRPKWIAVLTAVFLIILAGSVYSEGITVYTADTLVYFYKGPSASGKSVQLGYGEKLTCVEVEGSWAKVTNSSGTAYCRKSALTTTNPNVYSVQAYALTDAKLYKLPTTSSSRTKLKLGDSVTILAETPDGGFYRAKSAGKTGYIRKRDVSGEPLLAKSSGHAYVRSNIAKVYDKKSEGQVIAQLGYGSSLTYDRITDTMARVNCEGIVGWVELSSLSDKNPNVSPVTAYVKSGGRIYALPTSSSTQIGSPEEGTAVSCIAITGDWIRISTSGHYGYILKTQLTKTKPKSPGKKDDPIKSMTDDIIALAKKQLGKPYIYATRGPSSFDCSGLTAYVFGKIAGISLGRSAEAQGYDPRFPKISSISQLKKGDLVFFDTEADDNICNHVGIYLGGGKFIHASSRGKCVMISTLSSGFYHDLFTWGKRLVY